MEIWQSILEANVFQKIVFLVLLIFSVMSWAMFFYYKSLFRAINRHNRKFGKLFDQEKQWQVVQNATRKYSRSFFARIYHAVYKELVYLTKRRGAVAVKLDSKEDLVCFERVIETSLGEHVAEVSHPMRWMASIANTAPFIGLLGTVVGIIRSFEDISKAKSASLATVAPGIAEALVMTAIGLAVAIPAVIFFNLIKGEVGRHQEKANRFGAHLMNRIQKELV